MVVRGPGGLQTRPYKGEGKGLGGGGFREKCTRMHYCASFVAGGLSQDVNDGVSNRDFLGTFGDIMGVRRGLAGGRLGAR